MRTPDENAVGTSDAPTPRGEPLRWGGDLLVAAVIAFALPFACVALRSVLGGGAPFSKLLLVLGSLNAACVLALAPLWLAALRGNSSVCWSIGRWLALVVLAVLATFEWGSSGSEEAQAWSMLFRVVLIPAFLAMAFIAQWVAWLLRRFAPDA